MIEFESAVVPLVESWQDSNGKDIQNQLLAIFKQSENDEVARSEWAKKAFALSNQLTDDRRTLVLLAAALEVSWPDYPGGDGYYREPSDLATAATLIGINSSDQGLIDFTKTLDPCRAIEFFDLGIASNNEASAEQVLEAVKRTNLDPVLAVASVSPALSKKQIMEVLLEIESPSWLTWVLLKSDGWTWPEWQYAFEQASFNCEPTVAFWEVLLTEVGKNQEDESSELSWIADFMEEFEDNGGFDRDVSEENLELIKQNPNLLELALATNWEYVIEALGEDEV